MIPAMTLASPVITLDYRSQILGCWLGKAVGGTLGMPFEGQEGPLDLTFYDPVPTEMLPNDDLDLQVLWACVIDAMEAPAVDRRVLGQAWLDHVRFPWDEYGVAIRNLANGLQPPLSGSYDNWFTRGMGAAIRSELWACLAPGNPKLAAAYAYEDACVDHAGEGIWAEVFFAPLQSLAFTESSRDALLDGALARLPERSEIRQAVEQTRQWWGELKDWQAVRQKILAHHGCRENFTDAVMNVAFTILGWLAGDDDFSKSICIAVNCGKDTDCTGATLGALLGILDPDCIDDKWLAPIGRKLVLNKQIVGIQHPKSLDAFTDLVVDLRQRLGDQAPPAPSDEPPSTEHLEITVRFGFTDALPPDGPAPVLPADALSRPLSGTWARWDPRHIYGNVLLVEYPFYLDKRRTARVLFDSTLPCRVWIDQTHAFSHNGGPMCPSFHRAPEGHYRDMNLARGEHVLLAALVLPSPADIPPEWVVGLGDGDTHQWLPEAFLKPEYRTPEKRFDTRWRR
jgi:ADP-ribosylglycohydrolase